MSIRNDSDNQQSQNAEEGGPPGGGRAAAAVTPPSLLRQWTDLLASPSDWLSPSSCYGCLTHVDATKDDGDQGPARRAAVSLLDNDESTAATYRSRESSQRLNVDETPRVDSRKHTIPHDQTVSDSQCPICLNTMSPFDMLYPLECSCKYNFCLDCMSSLLSSSKDDYQVASDGSRRVKIKLNCPNCRTDISGILEDIIRVRQEAHSIDLESIAVTSTPPRMSNESASAFGTTPSNTSRLKNRSCAPRRAYQQRINDLIVEIESTPTPSNVRYQFSVHGKQEGVRKESASIDDALSQSSLSSVGAEAASILALPSRSPSTGMITTPISLRRSQSLKNPTCPPQSEQKKKKKTRSVLDSFGGHCGYDDDIEQYEHAKLNQNQSSRPRRAKGSSKVCLEGIQFNDGKGGFFSDAIDLDWCCSMNENFDINDSSFEKVPPQCTKVGGRQGCGGYVDYSGAYHPCTNVEGGRNQAVEWEGPCQGCIFRRGMHDGGDGNDDDGQEEDLYYDSDPGQHFTRSWTSPPSISHNSQGDVNEQDSSQLSTSSSTNTRQRAKLRWRQRRSLSKTNRVATTTSPEVTQQRTEENMHKRQEDQQAYLYDYFSRNDDASTDAARISSCPNMGEKDARKQVQAALNSKWRLQWHASITKNSKRLPPNVCDVWIERGYRRNRTEIVEPKLMWRELSQPNLQKHRLGGSTIRPYRVSLFAVRRIFQVESGADLKNMKMAGRISAPQEQAFLPPLAKPNCLLLVRSSLGEDYIFEASCTEERDQIVNLLKIATARLVSHAVVGNGELMLNEFFSDGFVDGGMHTSLISTDDG